MTRHPASWNPLDHDAARNTRRASDPYIPEPKTIQYVCNVNLPGCLPADDPEIFPNMADAYDWLIRYGLRLTCEAFDCDGSCDAYGSDPDLAVGLLESLQKYREVSVERHGMMHCIHVTDA